MQSAYLHFFSKFLDQAWSDINQTCLGGQLHKPTFQIDTHKSRHGFWNLETRTLGISANLLLRHSETEVLDVLKHEMAHQYADEVLGASKLNDETAHGSGFRHAANRLGIQHHARYAAHQEAGPILRRIQKLLALTQSDNPHEAQAAMMRARTLMQQYELDAGWEQTAFFHQFLGKPVGRKSLQQQLISSILVRFFNIAAIWVGSHLVVNGKNVWLLEISGTPSQLEIAQYVYVFLLRELEDLWRYHRARNPGVKGQKLKRDFQIGVLKGLIEKLDAQDTPAASSRTDLILQKQQKLDLFLKQRYPQMRSGRRMTYRKSDAFQAGKEQGKQLDIHKGIQNKKKPIKQLSS